ncbi:MAG: hypothetical protein Kow00105_19250 [Phycisphaeraceae bacterium]
MPSYLDLTVTNHIARLTFDRPKANSYDLDFMQQFNDALDRAQRNIHVGSLGFNVSNNGESAPNEGVGVAMGFRYRCLVLGDFFVLSPGRQDVKVQDNSGNGLGMLIS